MEDGEKAVDELVKCTLYEEAPPGNPDGKNAAEQAIGHASAEPAVRDPELYSWLLKWKLP